MVGYDPTSPVHLTQLSHGIAGAASGVVTRALSQPLDVLKIRLQSREEELTIAKKDDRCSSTRKETERKTESQLENFCKRYVKYGVKGGGHTEQNKMEEIRDIFKAIPATPDDGKNLRRRREEHSSNYRLVAFGNLQVEPISRGHHSAKYYGMLQACLVIHKEEGIRSFWKGHIPAQALSVVYGVVQFTVFEILTQQVSLHLPDTLSTEMKPLTHFVCGSLAGCAATLAAQPFDVIRTRFVAQGHKKLYHTMFGASRHMVAGEGSVALYKGLLPALIQIAPQNGFTFSFYSIFKGLYEHLTSKTESTKKRPSSLESIVCGSGAGICAKVIVYPLDMVKKRLQIVGFAAGRATFGKTRTYHGLIHCLRTVIVEEGARGLYKGLWPSVVKAMVTAGCSFWAYELFCNLLSELDVTG